MILAFDTSLQELSIGLFSDDATPLATFHYAPVEHERGVHDTLLAQKTAELLKEVDTSAKAISRIAVIAGPGSFTGLRIGYSFAKGIAFTGGAGIIPVSSHRALQASYRKEHDEQEGLLYAYPGYDKHSVYLAHATAIDDIALVPTRELLPHLPIVAPRSALALLAGKQEDVVECPIDLQVVAELAAKAGKFVGTVELSSLEPLYVTPFTPRLAEPST